MKNFSTHSSNPKIALIYDRVNTPHGGAEKVLLALHQAFPKAPLYTSVYSSKKADWSKTFKIKTSFLQKIPLASYLHRWIAPLMPIAFENLDLSAYDIIISITSAEAKGVLTTPNQLHICYLLTPTRYLYQDRETGLDSKSILKNSIIRKIANIFLDYLTNWDQVAITRPDIIVPISKLVSKRVARYHPHVKTNEVIYPPIEFLNLSPKKTEQENYFLTISRLVSYKKIDLAIRACHSLQKKLIIVGSGPEKNKLIRLTKEIEAKHLITFLENISEEKIQNLYQNCEALIMPGEEDFGIVALEANTYGKPVLINSKSGAAELIEHKKHGLHIEESVGGIINAINQLEKNNFSYDKIIQNPQKYGTNIFINKFSQLVKTTWENKIFEE